jgi:prepilin peptidase CpaA
MAVPATIVYAGTAVGFAAVASLYDLRERRIPNLLVGPAIVTGLLLHLMCGGLAQMSYSLAAGAIAGAIFLLFYVAGGMGAGDVKLIFAMGCTVGLGQLSSLLLATVAAGSLFAIAMAIAHGQVRHTLGNLAMLLSHHQAAGLTPHPELNVTNATALRLPYAVSIAAGCVYVLCQSVAHGAGR